MRAEEWRKRAEAARSLAANPDHTAEREIMLRIAAGYDRLAEMAAKAEEHPRSVGKPIERSAAERYLAPRH